MSLELDYFAGQFLDSMEQSSTVWCFFKKILVCWEFPLKKENSVQEEGLWQTRAGAICIWNGDEIFEITVSRFKHDSTAINAD